MTTHYYCLLYDIVIYLSCKPIILLDGSYSLLLHIQPIFSRPSAPHKKLLYSEISSCSARSSPHFVGAVVVTSLAPQIVLATISWCHLGGRPGSAQIQNSSENRNL